MTKAISHKSAFGLCLLVLLGIWSNSLADWTEPVRIGIPGGCLYPQILAEGDTLHVVYTNLTRGDKIIYLRSDDRGDTWSENKILSDTIDTHNAVFVRIARYDQQVIVLWRNIFDQGFRSWNIGYALSEDNGETWTEPLYVLSPSWEHILYFSAAANGPVVNIIVSRHIGYDLFFYSIRSTDFGESWSEPEEIFMAAMSSMTDQVSYNNMVYYSWAGIFDWEDEFEVYFLKSSDAGVNWSENNIISDNDQILSKLPSLCTDQLGSIGLCWWDYKYSPGHWINGDILIRQSFYEGASWGPDDQVTTEHRAEESDVFWTRDTLYIVWEDWRFSLPTIYYVCSPDSIHDWSNKQRLEDDPEASRSPVVAASSGKVYVVWADDRCDPDTNACGGIYFTRWEGQVGVKEHDDTILTDDNSLEIYPNPFNSKVIVSLKMDKRGEAEIGIYDVNGRLVKTLFKGGNLEKGMHKFSWDATDNSGKRVSSGVYFVKTVIPQANKIAKMVYLK
jgi:hypothetical protein